MFFILNNENTVLAADDACLEAVGVSSIFILSERFRSGEFVLDKANHTVSIGGTTHHFEKHSVQTLLGSGDYYQLRDAASESHHVTPVQEFTQDTIQPDNTEEAHAPTSKPDLLLDAALPAAGVAGLAGLGHSILSDTAEDVPHLSTEDSEASAPLETAQKLEDLPAPEDLLTLDDSPEITIPQPPTPPPAPDSELLDLIDLDNESKETTALETSALETSASTGHTPDTDDDLFELLDTDSEPFQSQASTVDKPEMQTQTLQPEIDLQNDATLSLVSDDAAAHIEKTVPSEYQINDEPFTDYAANASMIGISPKEYTDFLQQFTEESLQHETALKGDNAQAFDSSFSSIKDASQFLSLSQLSKALDDIEHAAPNARSIPISNFYGMVRHIRRDLKTTEQTNQVADSTAPIQTETPSPKPSVSTPSSSSFSLDAVDPIPFSFSAQTASDELGLPEPLVQEFIADFVRQSQDNIPLFEEAQSAGDLDTIQKTAHLLKGAASNLRIDPLAETLKTLQYNESLEEVPGLLHTFMGQLKTLVVFTEKFTG